MADRLKAAIFIVHCDGDGVSGVNEFIALDDAQSSATGGYDSINFESASQTPKLTTLASFNGANGEYPIAGLTIDAAGDLFGTTYSGGAGDGLVYEIVKASAGYASAPVTLVSFGGGGGGSGPQTAPIFDAAGDLFGTTSAGGSNDDATVFEIANTSLGYANTATTLVNLDQVSGSPVTLEPRGGLSIDAVGNLFGASAYGGVEDDGFIFEIAKTGAGYANTATTLLNLHSLSTTQSYALAPGRVTFDAAGNLLGTTPDGGANGDGAIFEIAKTGAGYADAAAILTNFNVDGGGLIWPSSPLVADAAGDLFGTAYGGGAYGDGGVFEVAKSATGYASAPTLLMSFDSPFENQKGGVVLDAVGDLFGAQGSGRSDDDGYIFELAKTKTGYASAATTIVSFHGYDGAYPISDIIADARGDLFGATAAGGSSNYGTVFEVTGGRFNPHAIVIATSARLPNSAAQTLTGAIDAAYAGLTISLYDGATLVGTTTAGAGAWTANVNLTGSSPHALTASATDGAGHALTSNTVYLAIAGGEKMDFPDASGDAASLYNTGAAWDVVNGGGGRIYLDSALASVVGGGDAIVLSGATRDGVGLYATNDAWDNVTGDDELIALTDAQASVTGGYDTIYLDGATGDAVSLYATNAHWDWVWGSIGSIALTDAQVSVTGGYDTIYFEGATGDSVSLYATNNQWDRVRGSNGSIALTDAQVSVTGGYDKIYFEGAAGDVASLYATGGHWDWVYGSNGAIDLTNAQVSVTGGHDKVFFNGANDAASLYATAGAWDWVYGNYGWVALTNAQASVIGGGDEIRFAGSGDAVSLFATNGVADTVIGANGTINLIDAQTFVKGGGDIINFDGAAGDTVTLSATIGDWDWVYGNNGTITLDGARVSVIGGDDTIVFGSGVGNAVSLYGTNRAMDTVTGGAGTIILNTAQVTVIGGGDTIDFVGNFTYTSSIYWWDPDPDANIANLENTGDAWDIVNGAGQITLTSAKASLVGGGSLIYCTNHGNAVSISATNGVADSLIGSYDSISLNHAQVEVTGGYDTINLTGTNTISLTGGAYAFVFQPGIGGQDVINGFEPPPPAISMDTMQFSASDFATWAVFYSHISQSGADTLITLDANDSVRLTNVSATALYRSYFSFV